MKTLTKFATFILTLLLVEGFIISPAFGAEKTYVMTGKITAVDPHDNTVVVNVPLGKNVFTVAGPLAPMAKLEKAGKITSLNQFTTGEHVTVKWNAVKDGHLITGLIAAK